MKIGESIVDGSAERTPSAAVDAGSDGVSDSCPTGSIFVHGQSVHWTPFCGQTCATSLDCPQGMACVKDEYDYATPVPVCVSDSVPSPLPKPVSIVWDTAASKCTDSKTFGRKYMNFTTGFAGWELLPCPGGCQSVVVDAGWGWATCSSPSGDAGTDAEVAGDAGLDKPLDTPVSPIDDAGPDGGEACPAGSIWVHGSYIRFTPFCGQTCATNLDCTQGMVCVKDEATWSTPQPVCVSDSVPPPLAQPATIAWDTAESKCLDDKTIEKRYINSKTGFAGYELQPCPGGCQSAADAGWNPWGPLASCPSTTGDAGIDH